MIQRLGIHSALLATSVSSGLKTSLASRSRARSAAHSPFVASGSPVTHTCTSAVNGKMSNSSSSDDEMVYDCEGVPILASNMIRIAQKAGQKIMEIYSQETEEWSVKTKEDESPLTRADIASNYIICEELKRLYPHIPMVSEENKQVPWEQRKDYTHFFCIDPLDGTKEFLKRNGQFTVNIGLCRGNEPVVGVVGVPGLDEPQTCYGVKGKGAIVLSDATGQRKAIQCASEFSMCLGIWL